MTPRKTQALVDAKKVVVTRTFACIVALCFLRMSHVTWILISEPEYNHSWVSTSYDIMLFTILGAAFCSRVMPKLVLFVGSLEVLGGVFGNLAVFFALHSKASGDIINNPILNDINEKTYSALLFWCLLFFLVRALRHELQSEQTPETPDQEMTA